MKVLACLSSFMFAVALAFVLGVVGVKVCPFLAHLVKYNACSCECLCGEADCTCNEKCPCNSVSCVKNKATKGCGGCCGKK